MSITLDEILTQADAWEEAIDKTLIQSKTWLPLLDTASYVLFTGCGSTYYLSLAASSLFQSLTHRPARGVPGSELALNGDTVLGPGKPALVAVSRSGATGETLRAVEHFQKQTGGPVIAITTDKDQPLATLADTAIVIESGQEKSVVQTRSFSSMYITTAAMAAIAAKRSDLTNALHELPDFGRQYIPRANLVAEPIGWDLRFSQFYFLGSGPLYGLASEASLKMKEMSLSVSEPFHFLEFRHGPMSMAGSGTMIVGLLSEQNRQHEQAVLDEMKQLGAETLSLGEIGSTIAFQSGLPEPLRGVLYLPPLQLIAYHRAIARGLDPDHPRNLSAVVRVLQ